MKIRSFYSERFSNSKQVNVDTLVDMEEIALPAITNTQQPLCTCGCCCSVEEIKGILANAIDDPSFRIIETQEQLGNNYYNAQDDTNDSQSITQ